MVALGCLCVVLRMDRCTVHRIISSACLLPAVHRVLVYFTVFLLVFVIVHLVRVAFGLLSATLAYLSWLHGTSVPRQSACQSLPQYVWSLIHSFTHSFMHSFIHLFTSTSTHPPHLLVPTVVFHLFPTYAIRTSQIVEYHKSNKI